MKHEKCLLVAELILSRCVFWFEIILPGQWRGHITLSCMSQDCARNVSDTDENQGA